MPTRFEPKQDRSRDAAAQILAAGIRHYKRVGPHAFTIEPIADALGVSKAKIYTYYKKGDLLREIENRINRKMTTYQKIPGPFVRSHETNLLTEEFNSPDLEALQDIQWIFTEKVDGTNVRVIWDGYRVTFGGRTDNAQLPMPLYTWLNEKFGGPEREQIFEQRFGDTPVVLYGEGYGPKIQSGGKYRDDISTVFYDIKVGDWWLLRQNVETVAAYFGVEVVPVVFRGTLREALTLVASGVESRWGGPESLSTPRDYHTAEGLVGTTATGLLGRDGQRIIVKIKARDFK